MVELRRHRLVLSMRTPTAKVIEEYVVDWAYETRARAPGTPPPTETERALAKMIDDSLKIGSTRAHLVLPDQKNALDDLRRQLAVLAKGLHPWQGKPFNARIAQALIRLSEQVEEFQTRSIFDRLVDVFKEGEEGDRRGSPFPSSPRKAT